MTALSSGAGSCRLLGVALVVDDISKGCNLAFRYPSPPSENASSFHTLPAPLLAKLFRPKNALCNASFELVVDNLRFVSHPVLVSRRLNSGASINGPGNATTSSSLAPGAALPVLEPSSSVSTPSGNEITMFNIIFALEDGVSHVPMTGKALESVPDTSLSSLEDDELVALRKSCAQAFHTVAAQLSNGLLHEELRVGFVSKEVRELLQVRDELAQSEQQRSSTGNPSTGIPANAGGTNLNAANGGNTASNSTIITTSGGGGSTGTSHHHHQYRKDGENGASMADVDQQTLIDISLGKSMLANDLKRVFHGLKDAGIAHVVLNGWVKLSLTLTDAVAIQLASLRPYHTLLLLLDKKSIRTKLPVDHARQLGEIVEAVNPLKSFQDIAMETAVPLHHVFRLAAHLVYWGFGRIVDAITLYNIYQINPKADLQLTSPLALEFRRKFAPYELGEVLATFSGTRRIGEYMKTLSTAKKSEYIHMVIWLLQHRFIIQLHRYIYFMIPSDGDYAADQSNTGASSAGKSSSSGIQASSFHRQRVHSNPTSPFVPLARSSPLNPATLAFPSPPTAAPLEENPLVEKRSDSTMPLAQVLNVASQLLFTDHERAYLAKIAKPNPVFTLFKRLCVYFHGEHHIEEIMWRENLSRGELRTVMSTYQDIIVCCLHE